MCRGGAQGQRNHRPEMPLAPMQVLKQYCGDGAITNDKFCWVRRTQLRLSWSRLALCSRPAQSDVASAESLLPGGSDATSVERTFRDSLASSTGIALGDCETSPYSQHIHAAR